MSGPCVGKAISIGWQAKQLLAPGSSGRFFAVTSTTAYLVAPDDEIVWVADATSPPHGRAIRGVFDQGAWLAGMPYTMRPNTLDCGGRGEIDLSDAAVWTPLPIPPDTCAAVEVAAARASQLRETLSDESAAFDFGAGFGLLVPSIAAAATGQSEPAEPPLDTLAQSVSPRVALIAQACLRRDMLGVVAVGRELVGLGPGLTPSGDDFLGGLLFVVYHLQAAYPGQFGSEPSIVDDLLGWADGRTHRISLTILRDHAAGLGAEPLHRLIGAILRDEASAQVSSAIADLLRIGSASGADMLAGAVAGLLFLAGR